MPDNPTLVKQVQSKAWKLGWAAVEYPEIQPQAKGLSLIAAPKVGSSQRGRFFSSFPIRLVHVHTAAPEVRADLEGGRQSPGRGDEGSFRALTSSPLAVPAHPAPQSQDKPLAFNSRDGIPAGDNVWCLGLVCRCGGPIPTCRSSWHLISPLSSSSPTASFQKAPETPGEQLCSGKTCWCCWVQKGEDFSMVPGRSQGPEAVESRV